MNTPEKLWLSKLYVSSNIEVAKNWTSQEKFCFCRGYWFFLRGMSAEGKSRGLERIINIVWICWIFRGVLLEDENINKENNEKGKISNLQPLNI